MPKTTPFRVLLLASLVSGCAHKREPAPTEMVDLARFVFQNWEDPEALPDAMDNLNGWLTANIDSDGAKDGFQLDPLAADDVAGVTHPDEPLADLIGASGAARSPFSLDDHAGAIVLLDQIFSNPGTYKKYDRTILEGEPKKFGGGGEELLRTSNAVETSTLGVTLDYTLLKDYRWVESESGTSIVARSWIEEPFCNEGGGTCLQQSYSVDLFVLHGKGETWRMTAAWNQLDSSLPIGEDLMIASLASGIQNVFKFTDQFLSGTEK